MIRSKQLDDMIFYTFNVSFVLKFKNKKLDIPFPFIYREENKEFDSVVLRKYFWMYGACVQQMLSSHELKEHLLQYCYDIVYFSTAQ